MCVCLIVCCGAGHKKKDDIIADVNEKFENEKAKMENMEK